jgi:flagellar motor switch protein FliM
MSGAGPVLTNDRVAELVAAALDGRLEAEATPLPARPPRRVRTVDFRRPAKFNAEQERRLKRFHDTFCQTSAVRLGTDLRTPLDLEVINISQLTWTSAHGDLPQNAICAVVETEPLGTRMLLAAELPLVLFGIERVLGGPAHFTGGERRLSEIDWVLARRLLSALVEQLSVIWHDLVGLRLRVQAVDSQPGTSQVAPVSEATLSITIEARVDQGSATLTLLVPYGSISEVADRFGGGDGRATRSADEQTVRAMHGAVADVAVEVRAEVGAVEMPIERVLALCPGDVIALGAPADGVTLFAGDIPVRRARPGRSGTRRAVQLIDGGDA